MKKYYLGFLILAAGAAALVVFVAIQGVRTKDDSKTLKAAQAAADKLNSYIDNKQSIPATLEQAGVTNRPDSITYQKIGTTKYKFCVSYKGDSAKGFGGVGSALTGQFPGSTDQPQDLSGSFDNSNLYISGSYKKGQNCQTITPYIYNEYSNNGSANLFANPPSAGASCTDVPNSAVEGDATVTSIDTSKKTISFSPDNQNIYDNKTGQQLPTITSKTYNSNTLFCDAAEYTPTTVSAIKPGDDVYIYLNSGSEGALAEVDIYTTPTLLQ